MSIYYRGEPVANQQFRDNTAKRAGKMLRRHVDAEALSLRAVRKDADRGYGRARQGRVCLPQVLE